MKYTQYSKDLENSEYYSQLKHKKDKLVAGVNALLEGSISTDLEKLKFIKNYASNSKNLVRVPEYKYVKLGKALATSIKKYNRLDKTIEKRKSNEIKFGVNRKQKALNNQKEKSFSD
jgi:hypothetical protein